MKIKRIYLVLPLIALLILVICVAFYVLIVDADKSHTSVSDNIGNIYNETVDNNKAKDVWSQDNTLEIDMSDYSDKYGTPTPHSSDFESKIALPLTPSEKAPGITTDIDINTVSFLAVGDNLIHGSIYKDAAEIAGGNGYNFDGMYEQLSQTIQSADLSFINQESPLAGQEFAPSDYPMFNTPMEMGETLLSLGFDIISIANNHMLDKYEAGLNNHISYWKSKPVTLIGGYQNIDDYNNVRVVEKNGISIALLSYTYGTNGMSLPKDSDMIIPLIKQDVIESQVKIAKQKADMVFVSIHWGDENTFSPNSEQRRIAKVLAENCVDVVLGHHSHTIQPIEWLDRPDGKRTLVAFSLSNFISAMQYPKNMLGGMLTFDIEKVGNSCEVINVLFTPTVTHYDFSWRNFKLYFLKDYNQELYQKARCSQFEQDYNYYYEKLSQTISDEFLPDYI